MLRRGNTQSLKPSSSLNFADYDRPAGSGSSPSRDPLEMSGSSFGMSSPRGVGGLQHAGSMFAGGPPGGRHRIFTWVPTEIGDENREISADEIVDEHKVPQRVLLSYIKSKIEEEDAFKSLPFALLLVVVFALSFLYHDSAKVVKDLEEAITVDMSENAVFGYSAPFSMAHKDVHDVDTFADFFSWLRVGVLPLLFFESRAFSELIPGRGDPDFAWEDETIPMKDRPFYLNFNRILGGVQLQQVAAPAVDCLNPDAAGLYKKQCWDARQVIAHIDLSLQPGEVDVMTNRPDYDESKTVWFLKQESEITAERRMKELERKGWLQEDVVQVSVDFMTYNAHFDLLTLSGIHFFFSRSGHIWKKLIHESMFLQSYADPFPMILWDGIFILQILWMFFTEVISVLRDRAEDGGALPALRKYLPALRKCRPSGFWIFVDWLSIFFAFVLMAFFVIYAGEVQDVKERALALTGMEASEDLGALTKASEDLFGRFREVSSWAFLLRTMGTLYPLVLMLRLFKAFDAQPRLALVTRTLEAAAVDIAHFGVAFFAIFSTYAVMGTALFGREVSEFCTFARALDTCFHIMMGDFDADGLRETGRFMAGVWFWTFEILILLIMLNMLLAVIMDTYSEVKGTMALSDTLFFQAYDMYRRGRDRWRGLRVSIDHVMQSYEQKDGKRACLESDELVSTQDFVAAVKGITEVQARRLLMKSVDSWKQSNDEGISMSEAMPMIAQINMRLASFIEYSTSTASPQNTAERRRRGSSEQGQLQHAVGAAGEANVLFGTGCRAVPESPDTGAGEIVRPIRALEVGVSGERMAGIIVDEQTPRDLAGVYSAEELLRAAAARMERDVSELSLPRGMGRHMVAQELATASSWAKILQDANSRTPR